MTRRTATTSAQRSSLVDVRERVARFNDRCGPGTRVIYHAAHESGPRHWHAKSYAWEVDGIAWLHLCGLADAIPLADCRVDE